MVKTVRDGLCECITFKEGVFEKREVSECPKELHGTIVKWKPSAEFFNNTIVEIEKIKTLFKTISCLCPGLKINLRNGTDYYHYYSINGLNDLVDETVKNKELIKNRLIINSSGGTENKYKFNLVMTYTENYSSSIVAYVNTGLTDTGAHITQLKTALTREMNKFFREKKWLKDKDDNLSGEDIQEGMYIVFNYTAPSVAYDAQVKSRITSIDTKFEISSFVENLQTWLSINEKEIKMIADKAINARKAREAAKKAREATREKAKKKEKALKFDSKLADCYSKDRLKCEIYVTEGK